MAGNEAAAGHALPDLLAALAHRGPDDRGEGIAPLGGGSLALAHTRLSILDLSAAGHQPMIHPRSGDRLVFNGEIYNFRVLKADLERAGVRFAGSGDSEVLLHALVTWGPECIARLQGMFAFAFHDVRADRLILARDSIGIKPLYVAEPAPGQLVFASEVRAILATGLVPRRIDRAGLATMLAYGAIQGPLTLFRGVRELPPGHFEIITRPGRQDGLVRRQRTRFWKPPAVSAAAREGAASITAAVRATVDAAVADHLVSDVPVGMFLSSGLDSTIVAGVAARHTSRLRSFTVGFTEDAALSEQDLASETAQRFGLAHTRIDVTGSDAENAVRSWLGALDAPSVDGFNVFLISQVVRAAGIKVALSGQGGDELFGGYPAFADVPRLRRWFHLARVVPPPLRRGLAAMATARQPAAVRAKAGDLAESDGDLLGLYLRRRRTLASSQLRALGLSPQVLGLTQDYLPPDAIDPQLVDEQDPVATVSRLETALYLGNMLLRDGDANGMTHGLEIRVPLLDQRLLDLALALPGDVRLPSGRADKHLLREAFPELLRPALTGQKKRGFVLPIARWMRGQLRPLCMAGLATLKETGLLDPMGVEAIAAAFWDAPDDGGWSRAFSLAVLGTYLRDQRATA